MQDTFWRQLQLNVVLQQLTGAIAATVSRGRLTVAQRPLRCTCRGFTSMDSSSRYISLCCEQREHGCLVLVVPYVFIQGVPQREVDMGRLLGQLKLAACLWTCMLVVYAAGRT
jgi:hypothetical protein